MARQESTLSIDGRTLTLSNVDKVLWPKDGITKGDLIKYYASVSRWMVPYLAKRPLSLQRYPDGIGGESFFSKNVPVGAPNWLKTVSLKSDGKRDRISYVLCDDGATLVYLANLAAITLHVWISHVGSLDEPDFVFFDLDPGERCPLKRLGRVALALRSELQGVGLDPIVKTTGGKGLHVLVPLRPGHSYPQVERFGELIARKIKALMPDDISLERSRASRNAQAVYFDYLQIGRGKTMAAAFSVRARPGAPVSMPIGWSVVNTMSRSATRDCSAAMEKWHIGNVPGLLRKRGDEWKGAFARGQQLEPAIKRAAAAWN